MQSLHSSLYLDLVNREREEIVSRSEEKRAIARQQVSSGPSASGSPGRRSVADCLWRADAPRSPGCRPRCGRRNSLDPTRSLGSIFTMREMRKGGRRWK